MAGRGIVREQASVWLLRLIAGAALLFFSEIVWWSNDPLVYGPQDWPALAAIYLALGALALDLLARFRVGDLFGGVLVGGVYGLLNGALVMSSGFADLPLSLVSRLMGLQTLGGGVMGLVFVFWLLDGLGPALGRAALLAILGVLSGIWMRANPLLSGEAWSPPPPETVLALLVGGLIVLGVLVFVARGAAIRHEDAFRLRPLEWGAVGGVLLVVAALNVLEQRVPLLGALIVAALVGFVLGVLLFQRDQHGPLLLKDLAPPRPVSLPVYVLYAAALALSALVGYALPGGGPDSTEVESLATLFLLFGVVWLPAISLWLGVRAYVRLLRERRS